MTQPDRGTPDETNHRGPEFPEVRPTPPPSRWDPILERASRLPMWSAYLIAPALFLLAGFTVIVRSESPFVLLGFQSALGLLCAATLHAYSATRRRVASRRR